MDLNTFGSSIIELLTRIAVATEGGKTVAAPSSKPPAETAAEKKAREAAEKKAAASANKKPTKTRDDVKKALVAVKDTISKEAAQEIFKAYGYEAMSAIEEKDFDAIFAAATKALEETQVSDDEPEDEL